MVQSTVYSYFLMKSRNTCLYGKTLIDVGFYTSYDGRYKDSGYILPEEKTSWLVPPSSNLISGRGSRQYYLKCSFGGSSYVMNWTRCTSDSGTSYNCNQILYPQFYLNCNYNNLYMISVKLICWTNKDTKEIANLWLKFRYTNALAISLFYEFIIYNIRL